MYFFCFIYSLCVEYIKQKSIWNNFNFARGRIIIKLFIKWTKILIKKRKIFYLFLDIGSLANLHDYTERSLLGFE